MLKISISQVSCHTVNRAALTSECLGRDIQAELLNLPISTSSKAKQQDPDTASSLLCFRPGHCPSAELWMSKSCKETTPGFTPCTYYHQATCCHLLFTLLGEILQRPPQGTHTITSIFTHLSINLPERSKQLTTQIKLKTCKFFFPTKNGKIWHSLDTTERGYSVLLPSTLNRHSH